MSPEMRMEAGRDSAIAAPPRDDDTQELEVALGRKDGRIEHRSLRRIGMMASPNTRAKIAR
jgi:hypothetical protein